MDDKLINDLEKYGDHLLICKANIGIRAQVFYGKKKGKCDCGFLEALDRAKVANNEEIVEMEPAQDGISDG